MQGREIDYILQTISIGQIAGNQIFSQKCQDFLRLKLGVAQALVTTSCTHALEMSAILLGIQPGDEVIVPSFTFVSTPVQSIEPMICNVPLLIAAPPATAAGELTD